MLYFLAISPINQTMIIAVIVIAGFIVGCLLARFIIRKIGKRTFRKLDIGSYLCPKCLEGKIVVTKKGIASNGVPYCSFKCTNNEARCDFSETRFGDLTPPGTLVTEDMTAQDIEWMRENRRRSNNSGTPIYSATQQSRGQGYVPNKHYRR